MPAPGRSLATWLGVLFGLLVVLIAIGGYVRLSGSGLSIPDWPFIHIGESRSLLPPMSEEGWRFVRERFQQDQDALNAHIQAGAVGIGSLGVLPASMAEFKRLFMVEWSHRFVAALLGLVALACLVTALRHQALRSRVAVLIGGIVGLIVFQAVLGGILVKSGTSTHWLFLHLGTAAVILSMVLWALLRSIGGEPTVDAATGQSRRRLRRLIMATMLVTWIQLVLGALVAGSRSTGNFASGTETFVSTWPLMLGQFMPHHLWDVGQSMAWNLLDNALLHQWVHRWFAMIVMIHLGLVFMRARKTPLGMRAKLGLSVAATFLGVQIIFGLANVFLKTPTIVALSHLVMANLLLASLALVLYDLRHERSSDDAHVSAHEGGQGAPA